MISSVRIAPQPPVPPTGHESPQEARDGGWLGQVPPPNEPSVPRCPPAPTPTDVPPMTGHESARDAREAGWLGQVPPDAPPTPRCPPAPAPADDPVTGYESPQQAREDGWLGQVPPPAPTPPSAAAHRSSPAYANPQLAPEPWNDSGSLFPTDDTLFG